MKKLGARCAVLVACAAMLTAASGCTGHRKRDAALAATTLFAAAVVAETVAASDGSATCELDAVEYDAWCGCEYGSCSCD